MAKVPDEIVTEYLKQTSGQGFSVGQIRQALFEAEGGASRVSSTSADSLTSRVLKSLSGRDSISSANIVTAAEDAGMSIEKADRLKRVLRDPDIVNDAIARKLLRDSNIDTRFAPEFVEKVARLTGGVAGRTAGKKAIGVLGGLLAGAGKLFASEANGIAGDFLQGTPAGAPGGLSSGELPPERLENPYNIRSTGMLEPSLEAGLTDRQVEGVARRSNRILARRERRGEFDISEEVMEEVRASQGEKEVITTASSSTSGNNNILNSLASLLRR